MSTHMFLMPKPTTLCHSWIFLASGLVLIPHPQLALHHVDTDSCRLSFQAPAKASAKSWKWIRRPGQREAGWTSCPLSASGRISSSEVPSAQVWHGFTLHVLHVPLLPRGSNGFLPLLISGFPHHPLTSQTL